MAITNLDSLTLADDLIVGDNITVGGDVDIEGAWTIGGALTVEDDTISTSTTTGCGIFGGGIGVAGRGNFGGIVIVTSTDATPAGVNAIYGHNDAGETWTSGNQVGVRGKVTLTGSDNYVSATGVWAGLVMTSKTGSGSGLAVALNAEASSNNAQVPNAIVYIQSLPGASANFSDVPYLVFSETRGGVTGTGSRYLFEVGHAQAATIPTIGTGELFYENTLQIAVNETAGNRTAFYIPLSSAEASYTTAFPIATTSTITLTPATFGTKLDFDLTAVYTKGTLINADFSASTTLTDSLVGMNLNLGTNVVATSEKSVKALDITLPQMTVSDASPAVIGVEISAAGAIAQTVGGTTTFTAIDVTLPTQSQDASTVTTTGLKVTGGTVNSGTQVLVGLTGGSTSLSIGTAPIGIALTGTYSGSAIAFTGASDIDVAANTDAALEFTVVGAATFLEFDTRNTVSGAVNMTVTGVPATITSAASISKHTVSIVPGTTTLDGATGATTPLDGMALTIAAPAISSASAAVTQASTVYIAGEPTLSGGSSLATAYAVEINSGNMLTAGGIASTYSTGTAFGATSTAPTTATNLISGAANVSTDWASGEINPVYGKLTIAVGAGGGNTYNGAGGHFETSITGTPALGLGLITGLMVKLDSTGFAPNAGMVIEMYPHGTSDWSDVPFIAFADYQTETGVQTDYLFEAGHAPMGATVSTGSTHLYHNETLKIKVNGSDRWLPLSTAEATYTTAYAIATTSTITFTPGAAGTFLDFDLNAAYVSGTLINVDFSGSTTLSSALVGLNLDLGANIVATSEQDVKGIDINLPQMTMSAATKTVKGIEITSAGAIVLTASGTMTTTAVDITLPEQTQTAGTVTTVGMKVTGGTVNSGTQTLVSLAGGSTALNIATATNGINITPTSMTSAIQIGAASSSAGSGMTVNTTAPVGFYFDDGGSALTAWGEAFTVGLVIPTESVSTTQTGWPCATHVYIDQQANLTAKAGANMCALNASYSIGGTSTLDGFDSFAVSALNVNVNVATGSSVAAGTTLAAINFSGNWESGTISGKCVPMIISPTNYDWSAFVQFKETGGGGCFQDAAAGSGGHKYLKVYIGDTLYTIDMATA